MNEQIMIKDGRIMKKVYFAPAVKTREMAGLELLADSLSTTPQTTDVHVTSLDAKQQNLYSTNKSVWDD